MALINIVQAGIIDHLNSIAWIVAFPLAVFITVLAAILLNATLSRKTIMLEWREADGKLDLLSPIDLATTVCNIDLLYL